MTASSSRLRASGLAVTVTDARGRRIPAGGLADWLARAAPRRASGAVAVAIIPDPVMRQLNREFRDVNRPTDVLSFPADPAPVASGVGSWGRFLGDIAIARGVAARQARRMGHALATEYRILALHGLLHLLGYDHDADRGEMARLEQRLRRRAGLPAGLIGRAARPPRPR
jgi:probable rRNA maturation factor